MYPEDLKYTSEHEWLRNPGETEGSVRIGITNYAQDALGDIVFVQLPEVGDEVTPGTPIGEVESTKSVSDVYAPIAGVVAAVNDRLADAPETINADPYGEGWLVVIEMADATELGRLMDSQAYQRTLEEAEQGS